jgi:hypothetical protein
VSNNYQKTNAFVLRPRQLILLMLDLGLKLGGHHDVSSR